MNNQTYQITTLNSLEEARAIAAQCCCDSKTKNLEMNSTLVENVAQQIANWIETAAMYGRNANYYHELLARCGKAIGNRAFIADDGTRNQDVLCDKIPEIIEVDYKEDLDNKD